MRLLILALALCGALEAKKRDWQMGKVLDVGSEEVFAGSYSPRVYDARTRTWNDTGVARARYNDREWIAIDGGSHIYVASRLLKWRWSKEAELTVNAPVQFAVEKGKVYVKDERGREHRLHLRKKILREGN